MSLNSVVMDAGEEYTHVKRNNERKDILQEAGEHVISTGAAGAYVVTIDNNASGANDGEEITAINAGHKIKFKANHDSPGASTLLVQDASSTAIRAATAIKKEITLDLALNDIRTDQIVEVTFDGTNYQLTTPYGQVNRSSFGGDGNLGALDVAAGTTTLDLGSAKFKVFEYEEVTVQAGATLNFSSPHANGTYILFKTKRDLNIQGTIDATGVGAAAGNEGNFQLSDVSHIGNVGGSPGGTVAEPAGANGLAFDTFESNWVTIAEEDMLRRQLCVPLASGGTNGADGYDSSGVGTTRLGGSGGAGGRAGGTIVFEVGGALNFTAPGKIDVSGEDGSDGGDAENHVDGSGTNRKAGASGGGGGAGGMGGLVIVLYNELTANTGTIDSSGGRGGAGGAGGRGEDGNGINGVPQDGKGGGGGGGAAGAVNTGRGGQSGITGINVANNNNGNGSPGGSGGSGGSGGNSFLGNSGSLGTQGTRGANISDENGSAGGNGGNGGNGAGSAGGLVIKNHYF